MSVNTVKELLFHMSVSQNRDRPEKGWLPFGWKTKRKGGPPS